MVWPLVIDYQEYPINRHGSHGELSSMRPVIDIRHEGMIIKALVDSGADRSVSFKQVGEVLGLDFTHDRSVVSNLYGLHRCDREGCELNPLCLKTYEKPLSFSVGDKQVVLPISWIERKFNVETGFMLILGRDFFSYFDILFKQRDEQFALFPHEA